MNRYFLVIPLFICIPLNSAQAESNNTQSQPTVNDLLQVFRTQGATSASAEQGRKLWQKKFTGKGEFQGRSCTSCHTENLTKTGKHVKTGKAIKPMSPIVNPRRLTDQKKIKKWFKRNCKWTLGRECTVQEKANILVYISG